MMIASKIIVLATIVCSTLSADVNTVPDGLSIGAASAAYQVEGGWNANDKGESIWDHLVHTHPEWIDDNTNGDVADDSYHKYEVDAKILRDIGMQHYRFSISWPRVLPTGDITNVDASGINYYNLLINSLLDNGIQPMVTMYHWDLPQKLQDLGGWANPILVDYFEDYARLLYSEFGDRVKLWITFNEPLSFVTGYAKGERVAPAVNAPGVGDLLAGHTLLKAHARAYHLYDEQFREEQQGKVTITLNCGYAFPKTDSDDDRKAAELAMQFSLGWFAHPIYSEEGDYPAVMKERINNQSKAEGRYRSRLPEFGDYWVNYIKGTYDYFGLNIYSGYLATLSDYGNGYATSYDPSWPQAASSWLHYVPEAMRNVLNWISNEYNQPDIFITENGWGDYGGTNDTMRVLYYNSYIAEMLKAVHLDNCSVIGFTAWSIMDNFEWNSGYSIKFGLYDVDFDDPERPRTPKASAEALALIASTRKVPEEFFKDVL